MGDGKGAHRHYLSRCLLEINRRSTWTRGPPSITPSRIRPYHKHNLTSQPRRSEISLTTGPTPTLTLYSSYKGLAISSMTTLHPPSQVSRWLDGAHKSHLLAQRRYGHVSSNSKQNSGQTKVKRTRSVWTSKKAGYYVTRTCNQFVILQRSPIEH